MAACRAAPLCLCCAAPGAFRRAPSLGGPGPQDAQPWAPGALRVRVSGVDTSRHISGETEGRELLGDLALKAEELCR